MTPSTAAAVVSCGRVDADIELLDAWRAGDRSAGVALFDRHFRELYRFFRNKAADRVDDLVQQTLLACMEARERLRGSATFRTYMFAVARNQLYRYWRERDSSGDGVDLESKSIHDLAPSAASVMGRRAEERLLLEALRRIPLEFQIALELYYFEGMRGPQIAETLEVPEATVRSRLRRGLEHLRRQIEALSSSPELLQSTLTGLDQWAGGLARVLGAPESVTDTP